MSGGIGRDGIWWLVGSGLRREEGMEDGSVIECGL